MHYIQRKIPVRERTQDRRKVEEVKTPEILEDEELPLPEAYRVGCMQQNLWEMERLATSSSYSEEEGPLLIIEPRRSTEDCEVHWLNDVAFDVQEKFEVQMGFAVKRVEAAPDGDYAYLDPDVNLLILPQVQLSDLSYPSHGLVHELLHLRFREPVVTYCYNAAALPNDMRKDASAAIFGKTTPPNKAFDLFVRQYKRMFAEDEVEAIFGQTIYMMDLLSEFSSESYPQEELEDRAAQVYRVYELLATLAMGLYHIEVFSSIERHALTTLTNSQRTITYDDDIYSAVYVPGTGRYRNPEGGIVVHFDRHQLQSWAVKSYRGASSDVKEAIDDDLKSRNIHDRTSFEGALCVWTHSRRRFLEQVMSDVHALVSLLPPVMDCARKSFDIYDTLDKAITSHSPYDEANITRQWDTLRERLRPALETWSPENAKDFIVVPGVAGD